jgi:hypothetical protein
MPANPTTSLTIDPYNRRISFKDNKDNDLNLKGFRFKGANGVSADIDDLSIRNNASDVRLANVPQMMAVVEQINANWAGLIGTVKEVRGLISDVLPIVAQMRTAQQAGDLQSAQEHTKRLEDILTVINGKLATK